LLKRITKNSSKTTHSWKTRDHPGARAIISKFLSTRTLLRRKALEEQRNRYRENDESTSSATLHLQLKEEEAAAAAAAATPSAPVGGGSRRRGESADQRASVIGAIAGPCAPPVSSCPPARTLQQRVLRTSSCEAQGKESAA